MEKQIQIMKKFSFPMTGRIGLIIHDREMGSYV